MENGNNEEWRSRSNWLVPVLLTLLLLVALGIFCELGVLMYGRLVLKQEKVQANGAPSVIDGFQTSDDVDYGTPSVNGLPIATPAAKIADPSLVSQKDEKAFKGNVDTLRKKGDAETADLLLKRDAFAERRLKLLRALERAKTSEERESLISKLKKL